MKQIEIDLDVHRLIENARKDFEESPNGILRRLLGIDRTSARQSVLGLTPHASVSGVMFSKPKTTPSGSLSEQIAAYQANRMANRLSEADVSVRDWMFGGASLPEGTRLQKFSRKQKYEAVIHNGAIFVNGEYHQSPSAAAMAVNGGVNVNGWDFWEYFDEVTLQWNKLDTLRKENTNE
jgi:hypothetical protein